MNIIEYILLEEVFQEEKVSSLDKRLTSHLDLQERLLKGNNFSYQDNQFFITLFCYSKQFLVEGQNIRKVYERLWCNLDECKLLLSEGESKLYPFGNSPYIKSSSFESIYYIQCLNKKGDFPSNFQEEIGIYLVDQFNYKSLLGRLNDNQKDLLCLLKISLYSGCIYQMKRQVINNREEFSLKLSFSFKDLLSKNQSKTISVFDD